MKKFLTLTLCAAMVLSVTACEKKEEEKAQDPSTTVVTVWSGNGHDKAFLNREIQKWNEEEGKKEGIKIEYLVQEGGQMNQKLDIAFQSDSAPDLFTGGSMAKLVENDQIIALDDMPGGQELIDRFSKYLMEGRHQLNGKTYSVPKTATTQGLIYNRDMFKKAGLVDENGEPKPPETFDELREYAKKLTDESKKEYGIIYPGKFAGWYMDDIMSISVPSGSYMDGYNPKTGEFDYTKMGYAMKTIMGIKEDKSYYPGVENLDNDPARARFGQGGIGMKTAQSYDYGVLTDQFPTEIDWDVAPFPVENKDDIHKQYMGVYGYMVINKHAVDKIGADKLMKVYNFFYSPELIINAYKEGIDIPLEWDLVKDIELPEDMKQWRNFASFTKISQSSPLPVKVNSEGITKLPTIWLNDIWPGKIPVDEIDKTLEDYTKQMNDAAASYKEQNPEYDPIKSGNIIESWETKRGE